MEFGELEGLRLDGQCRVEMIQLRAKIGSFELFLELQVCSNEMGNTKVIVAVYGPCEHFIHCSIFFFDNIALTYCAFPAKRRRNEIAMAVIELFELHVQKSECSWTDFHDLLMLYRFVGYGLMGLTLNVKGETWLSD
ncbi:hypothetical protein Tco_0713106 [Tanacetum coccineum]